MTPEGRDPRRSVATTRPSRPPARPSPMSPAANQKVRIFLEMEKAVLAIALQLGKARDADALQGLLPFAKAFHRQLFGLQSVSGDPLLPGSSLYETLSHVLKVQRGRA